MTTLLARLCVIVCLLLTFGPVNMAQAIPVTYTYVGSHYTDSDGPDVPGFTFDDYISATVTLDSSLWGKEITDGAHVESWPSGPWPASCDFYRITTDSAGRITDWYISGSGPSLDTFTAGALDGSGMDGLAGWPGGGPFHKAYVRYEPGPRAPGTGWVMAPDPGSTLLLLGMGVVGLAAWRKRRE